MDFQQILRARLSFQISDFVRSSSNFDTVFVLLRTSLCLSVTIRVFNTLSLKVIYVLRRFRLRGLKKDAECQKITIVYKASAHGFVRLLYLRFKI